ncbi:SNF2 family N-terminal domain-containing protein [Boeremia exigua]|uniref:SNF2 family N-terminal domain-containing protein n=1 Tax=Boeremia exigua TaxID=749465 RepID=UPI001E8E9B31|nr:SNF2 family N-terminal domain-containing protein [Boeremia exigua]KAH6643114.1 SNF2 family N-terminal domain-containing protein [Boeremia exigua]
MATNWISPQQLQCNIDLIEDLLQKNGPDYLDRPFYEDMLEEQYAELAYVQSNQAAARTQMHSNQVNLEPPQMTRPVSPASSSGASRKRSIGYNATYPDSKRPSVNPSPLTPNTPNSVYSEPTDHRSAYASSSRQQALPLELPAQGYQGSNRQQILPYASGRPAPPNVIDLTESNPPTPDPFPELEHAFLSGAPQPMDAFAQEFMPEQELAQFLLAPTPAGTSYAFQQPLPIHQHVAGAAYGAYEAPEVPLYIGNADKPWAPSDNEDEYGAPLTVDEAQAVENLLGNVSAHDAEDAPERREQTPRIMCSALKEYQKIGLTWLMKMETGTNKGGILADGMGLGKTVQAISLICARPSDDPRRKTTLIIAPVALMRQWEKEIERHVDPRHRLRVYVYHGTSGKNADFAKLRQFDVVLTTFGILTSELKQKERKESARHVEEQRTGIRRKPKDKLALLGPECMWYRIIIDEAQCIKNRQTAASKAAHELMAMHRVVMTGTPMMNSIDELFPLIRFLRIPPYDDWSRFNQDFSKPLRNTHSDTRKRAMQRVQVLLKSLMLRRQKDSIVDGEIVCKLPPKHLSKEAVEFSDAEMELYRALENKSQIQLNKYLERGTLSANYANVLVLLLRLRQACCHPHLIKDLSQPATENIAEDDLLSRAGALHEDVVNRLKTTDDFECPVCFDVDLNPTIIVPCGHTVCGECVQKLVDPTRGIRDGHEHVGAAKCPQCRGELKAAMITDYKHFCKVHAPEKLEEADRASSEEPVNDESDSDDSDDDDEGEDVDKNGNLVDFVVPDEEESEYEAETSDVNDDEASVPAPSVKSKKKAKSKSKSKGKAKAKPKVTLAQLKKDSLRSKAAKQKYLRRLRKNWVSSAKIEKTMELVSDIAANDPTDKILIFSQFTSLLDLLEVPMYERRLRYQRYDGSMTMGDRADAVERFMDDPDEKIMLLSLKAGNAGLNLAKASQVIILDPFWNPYVEEQAIDRAHRMPQRKEVTVHRVLVPETVEDRICEIQDKKRQMIDTALDETSSKGLTRLGARELRYIFGMG